MKWVDKAMSCNETFFYPNQDLPSCHTSFSMQTNGQHYRDPLHKISNMPDIRSIDDIFRVKTTEVYSSNFNVR